jgi:hypothetical protein
VWIQHLEALVRLRLSSESTFPTLGENPGNTGEDDDSLADFREASAASAGTTGHGPRQMGLSLGAGRLEQALGRSVMREAKSNFALGGNDDDT